MEFVNVPSMMATFEGRWLWEPHEPSTAGSPAPGAVSYTLALQLPDQLGAGSSNWPDWDAARFLHPPPAMKAADLQAAGHAPASRLPCPARRLQRCLAPTVPCALSGWRTWGSAAVCSQMVFVVCFPAGLGFWQCRLHVDLTGVTRAPAMWGLASVQVLDLSRNRLEELPAAVGQMLALRELDIR